jgi:AcrR family transcriptional regulator
LKPRSTPLLSERKHPVQARSTQLVADILEAAVRVLAREGARRFTTVRVAAEAGVSVGSLYQYFPNKEALLFRLQADEWKETGDVLAEILGDPSRPPLERLRRAIRAFFRSERAEAELRTALADAGALYRDAPETHAHRASVTRWALTFLEEVLPDASPKERAFAAEVVMTSMAAIGKRITTERRSRAEIDAWAEIVADMQCGYLERLARESSCG